MLVILNKDQTKIGKKKKNAVFTWFTCHTVILAMNKVTEKFGFWVLVQMGYFPSHH